MKPKALNQPVGPFLAAGLCAGAWIVFWMVVVRPAQPVTPRQGSPARARVFYRPLLVDERFAEGSEVRAIWSPVLFSLPTPYGFSGPLLEERGGLPPPLSAGSLEALPLPHPARRQDDLPRLRLSTSRAAVLQRIPQPREPPLRYPPPVAVDGSPLRLKFEGPFSENDFTQAGLPPELTGQVSRLAMDVALVIGAEGMVQHALIERSSGQPHLDRVLIDALYRWRMPPPGDILRGTVLIRSLPLPPAADTRRITP